MRTLLFAIAVAIFQAFTLAYNPTEYKCSFCLNVVDSLAQQASVLRSDSTGSYSFKDLCSGRFPSESCSMVFEDRWSSFPTVKTTDRATEFCHRAGVCPNEDVWTLKSTPSNIDVRVSKAIGSRGYNKVRVSVVSNATSIPSSSIYTYQAPFRYKWTDKFLSSGIVDVTPGVSTSIPITPSLSIDVYVPKPGEGTRGVIIADPCFQSKWIKCLYEDKFQMFEHSTELLNAINSHDDVSYWQILGDNFYDQDGQATSTWFDALTLQSKSKIFATVPGNHDFWVHGSPPLWVSKDQLGNGFMQYYGQDVMASLKSNSPYDFSVDPASSSILNTQIPLSSNYFFYNSVGNVGFIGFSGAHTFSEMTSEFAEACSWASSSSELDVILLLGHWNVEGMGCTGSASVPDAYKKLLELPQCQAISSKIKYFMGHKHCSYVTEPNVGFMVGAVGMSDETCEGSFGIPVVDTTGGKYQVYYFPVSSLSSDNYDTILSCIKANGVSGCYHLAQLWSSVSL